MSGSYDWDAFKIRSCSNETNPEELAEEFLIITMSEYKILIFTSDEVVTFYFEMGSVTFTVIFIGIKSPAFILVN